MNLYFLLVVLVTQIFVHENEAKTAKIPEANNHTNVKEIKHYLPPQVYKKTAELLHMINKINNDDNVDGIKSVNIQDSQGYVNLRPIDDDYFGIDNNKQTALRSLMKTLQKNYDSNKAFDNNNADVIRLHVISNTEVLEAYKKNLRSKDLSTSSSSSDEDVYDDESDSRRVSHLRDVLSALRRQAVLRSDNPSSEEYKEKMDSEITQDVVEVANTLTQSMEDDQLQFVKQKHEKSVITKDLENIKRKRASNEQTEVDNWEMITKKYDWEDKEDMMPQDNKQKNDWDYTKKDIPKSTFNYRDENTMKKEKWQHDWSERENEKEKYNKKWDESKIDDSWNSKKKSKNNDWDKRDSKIDVFEDHNVGAKKEDWDELPRKKKSQDFSNEINKNKSWNQKREKVKTKDWDNAANSWGKPVKSPDNNQMRTTKRKWKKPDFKINEWNDFKPKGKKQVQRNGPAFAGFGRTPIPFVGRHGVYDDK